MIDLSHLSDYLIALVTGYVGYIHNQLGNKVTREELADKLESIKLQLEYTREDIKEVKEDIKEIRTSIDNQL